MRPLPLEDVARILGGWLSAPALSKASVRGAVIDSRLAGEGSLFFALPGSNVHGIHFVDSALGRGAVAAVVDRPLSLEDPHVLVPDVAAALAKLAQEVRIREHDVPTAAITGSVGKTTTCTYVHQLLSRVGTAHRPRKSFNNHLGVPLTILGVPERCDYSVVEIGTNAPGEVRTLARWVRPQVTCVTAVEAVHLDGLGSLVGVAREKLSIIEALQEDGVAWIPVEVFRRFASWIPDGHRIRTFGTDGDLELRAGESEHEHVLCLDDEIIGSFTWAPPFPHSPRVLEAALAVCHGLGAPLEDLLEEIPELALPELRGESQVRAGVELLLDCYNASPPSLESSLGRLEREPAVGRRVCVLGTMEELGLDERRWHEELGARIALGNFDDVFLMGRARDWYHTGLQRAGSDAHLLDRDDASARRLAGYLRSGDRVLFKASRSEQLEDFAARVGELLDAHTARDEVDIA